MGACQALRRGAPDEGLWQGFKREIGSMVAVRRATGASPKPEARYERAMARLEQGQVDVALAETMRLPGAARAGRGSPRRGAMSRPTARSTRSRARRCSPTAAKPT